MLCMLTLEIALAKDCAEACVPESPNIFRRAKRQHSLLNCLQQHMSEPSKCTLILLYAHTVAVEAAFAAASAVPCPWPACQNCTWIGAKGTCSFEQLTICCHTCGWSWLIAHLSPSLCQRPEQRPVQSPCRWRLQLHWLRLLPGRSLEPGQATW